MDRRDHRGLRLQPRQHQQDHLTMTPEELQTFIDALQSFLGTDFVLQLRDILSYMLGGFSGLAFAIAASMRWH